MRELGLQEPNDAKQVLKKFLLCHYFLSNNASSTADLFFKYLFILELYVLRNLVKHVLMSSLGKI